MPYHRTSAPGASEPTAENSRRHRHFCVDSDENESLQRLVHLQCNTSLRGTRKLRVAGWGLLPRPPPRHRKHYTGACAHACGHDIFCGSSSNRNTRPVTHATLCAKWPGNCCECLSHISGALRSSSSLLSISLVEPIPKHQKDMDKLPVLSLGPIHSGTDTRATRARTHAHQRLPARKIRVHTRQWSPLPQGAHTLRPQPVLVFSCYPILRFQTAATALLVP